MKKEEIIAQTCKKHIKIFKLKQLGLTNKDIAESLGTNVGHVGNVLKSYENDPERVAAADSAIN